MLPAIFGHWLPMNIMNDIQKETPDIYLIDYRLPGYKNGIDVAVEILSQFPMAHILFITADESVTAKVSKNPVFRNKSLRVLFKPVRLDKLEEAMLQLFNKK